MKKKIILKIEGMHCASCSTALEKAFNKLDSVSASVNLATEKAFVSFDDEKISLSQLVKCVKDSGFKIGGDNAERRFSKDFILLIICAVFAVPLFYISMGHMLGAPLPSFLDPENSAKAFALSQLILCIPVILAGYRFYAVGFGRLIKLKPNMDSLIAIGTAASFLFSLYQLILIFNGQTSHIHNLYFESTAVIITLVKLGKYLESRSKRRAGSAIKKLLELAPETGNVLRTGEIVNIPADEIEIGETVVLRVGDKVPVDGVILEGGCSIDQSALTGESFPADKKPGDTVSAGGLIVSGYAKYKSTKKSGESAIAEIIKLVEGAQSSKAPIAKTADIISGYFVPVILAIALISSVTWALIGKNFEFCLNIFVSVLVIACPCALGLATPTAIMVGSGKAAGLGIFFKSAESLEGLGKADIVVFDKTGTVTEGKMSVSEIIPENGVSEEELLSLAGAMEQGSDHPVARAITERSGALNIEVSGFSYITGHGIECMISGKKHMIGNRALLEKNDIKIAVEKGRELESQGKIVLFLADEKKYLGLISLSDTIKKESADAVAELKRLGIKTAMLTGDNPRTAEYIAKQAGIDEYRAEVLPKDKSDFIEGLKKKNLRTVFVGDGINDAPALTAADTGVAIGSGTDIAIESADVVLMKDELSSAVTGLRLSRATLRVIKQNLFWAFIYNIIGVPVAAGVFYSLGLLLNPMIGAGAMALSSVCVVLNALRLGTFKFGKK